MERTFTETSCDVCGKKEKYPYHDLADMGWTKYEYRSHWQSGIHSGYHDRELIVCKKCDKGKEGKKTLLKGIKGLLK